MMWSKILVIMVIMMSQCLGLITGQSVYDIIGGRCCMEQSCYPTDSDFDELKGKMSGVPVFERVNTTGYKLDARMYNTKQYRTVGLIVKVTTVNDVKEVILFAKRFNLHVTIRSSGHDYLGRSTWEGSVNINLSEMKDIEVNLSSTRSPHGEIKVQTAARWKDIYQKLITYNRTVVGGSAHTVAAGGYTLGGGHSPISRSHGYAVDNLLEVQVVLADGRLATCTKDQTVIEEVNGTVHTINNGDLFWALSGGGGGSFGVAIYFVYKLHPQPSQMVTLTGIIPLIVTAPFYTDLSDEVFRVLKNLINKLPNEWGGYWITDNREQVFYKKNDPNLFADIYVRGSLYLAFNKFAPWDEAKDVSTFEELMDLKKKHSLHSVVFTNRTSFWDYEQYAADPEWVRNYLITTLVPKDKVDDSLFGFLKKEFYDYMKDDGLTCTGVLLGGKTNEVNVDATPLNPGYRNTLTCLVCGVDLISPEFSDKEQCIINKADAMNLRMRRHGRGMYFNEATENNPTWKEDYWGTSHYNRLLQIKREYDPDNFFTCKHCVGSDLVPAINKTTNTTCKAAKKPSSKCNVTASAVTAVPVGFLLLSLMAVVVVVL